MSVAISVIRSLACLLVMCAMLSAGEASGTGLAAQYYANETLSGTPAVTRTDPQVNFAWAGGAPAAGMPVDSFSVRWDGEFEAVNSEAVTLITRTDDGVRLWVNGSLVIDAWVLRSAADSTYTFTVVAGERYRIRMEYYEHFGSAVAQLEWQSATLPRAAIPANRLYPVVPTEAPVGTGTGLLARYFANETLSDTPVVSRTDATVDFGWGGGTPAAAVPVDGFSARWDGEIEARYDEPLTITARTDDGVRVWLDGILVIDAWVLRSAANSSFTFSAEAGHRYRIRMEYFEHTGDAVARLWWQSLSEFQGPIPSSQLYPTPAIDLPTGTGTGLLARFYANETLSGTPVLTRTDARVDFDWAGGSPGAGVPANIFSARWDGEIEPRSSEDLTLILRTDDGVRLWLDDQLVINAWILRGAADSTYTFTAQAGHRYRIRIDYFEHQGSAVAKLLWQSPSEPKGPVPTSQLYPSAPVEPPLGTGTGLAATYFPNETLAGTPALTRLDPVVDFDWAGGSPGSPILSDSFSARWEGELEPRYTEALTITARTDDGVKVWIDDQPVITAWVLRSAADSTYTFNAQAGHRYRIRMEYYEHFGSAVARLWWQSAHELRGPIPTTQLYPAGTVQTPVLGFAAAGSAVSEKSGSTTIAVTLSPASTTPVTVALSATGSGAQVPTSLTIPAGDTTASIPVTIQDDPRYGPNCLVTIALSDPVGATLGQATHVLTLQNTDPKPTLSFTSATSFNLEQSGTASVVVRLSAVSAVPTTVSVQTSGTATVGVDYTAPAATLQIPADTFEGTIFIPLLADTEAEVNETIVVALANPIEAILGGITTHTLTISDGNLAPVIVSGPTPLANPVTGTSVTLSFQATDDGGPNQLSFTWSATGPASVAFTPSVGTGAASTTIAGFQAAGIYTIRVTVRDSYNVEGSGETTLTVQPTPASLTISPDAATVPLDGTTTFTVSALDQFGIAYSQPLSVDWSTDGGGTITPSGIFTAANTAGGPFIITATVPTAQDTALVSVVNQTPPSIITQPSPQSITVGQTATFTVVADGAAPLLYQWSKSVDEGQTWALIAINGNAATYQTPESTFAESGTVFRVQVSNDFGTAESNPSGLTVNKLTQSITFQSIPDKKVGDAPFAPNATASSGLALSYSSSNSAVATIVNGLITIQGIGTTTITASQAGDTTYGAAVPVDRPFIVNSSSPTDPTEPPIGEWTADFIAQLSITGYETGSENELVDGEDLHYTNSTSGVTVTVTASSPSGATVQSVAIMVGEQVQTVLGNSGSKTFSLSEGSFLVSLAITGGNNAGSGIVYQDTFDGKKKRIVVDRTIPYLSTILPKRLIPTEGDQDYETDRSEYPFIRREEQRIWINGMTESWNKPLRARYSHPFFGSGDLSAGILAAINDTAGLDQRHTTEAVEVKVVNRFGVPTNLTASIINEQSSDEDHPIAGESSTKQRLIIRGVSGLGDSWSKNGGSASDPGDYQLKIKLKDKAGNESEDIHLLTITVDKLAPDAPKDQSDEPIGGNYAFGWSGSTTPFRFISPSADEAVLLVWQTSSTGQTPPTTEPLRSASGAWRLNQTLPGTPESGGDEGSEWFAWTANGQFVFTDLAGNKNTSTSSPLKFVCSPSAGPLTYESGSLYHVLVPGVYARDKNKDTIYLYDWIGDVNNQEEEKDQSPTAMELYGESQLYTIQRNGPGEYTKEERNSRPEILDGQNPPKYNVEQVSPLDPEQSSGSQEVLWVKPAILTVDPSWKGPGGQSPTIQQVVVLDKPELLTPSGGSISISTSTEPMPPNNAQPYQGDSGLTANFSLSRSFLTPGYGVLGYAYGNGGSGGDGGSSSFSSLAGAGFYSEGDPEGIQASLQSFAGGGHYDYSVTAHYWINAIKVEPDIVVSGDRVTISIEAGFFNDQNAPTLFQSSGDYVRFCDGDDSITRSVSESQSPGSDPNYFKGKIAILAQRLVFAEENHWNKQRLELDLMIDPDVEGKLYNIDVRLGSVRGYTSDLDTPNRGTSFGGGVSHRMNEGFNVIRTRLRLLMPDDDGTTILAGEIESVKPIPDIEFDVTSASLQSGDYMTVSIQGRLRDMLSECASQESAAVQVIKIFNGTTEIGEIEVEYGPGSPPWKKRTLPESFSKTLTFSEVVAKRGVNIRLEATNGAGNKGVYAVAIPVAAQVTTAPGSAPSSIVADNTRLTLTTDANGIIQSMAYPLPGQPTVLSPISPTIFQSVQFSGIGPVKTLVISITEPFSYNAGAINVMTTSVELRDVGNNPIKTSSATWIETAAGSKVFRPDTSSTAFAVEVSSTDGWTSVNISLKSGANTLAQASGPGSGSPVSFNGGVTVSSIPDVVTFAFVPSSAVPPIGNTISGAFSLLDASNKPIYQYSGDWTWNGSVFRATTSSAAISGTGSSISSDSASDIPIILPARPLMRGHYDNFRPYMLGFTFNSGIPGTPEFKVGGQAQQTEKE